MVKTTTKQKTIEYESRDIVCDLCEAEVPEGQAIVSIVPAIARNQGTRFNGDELHRIDICSVDCLVKNAAAAGLVLNTKILPDIRGRLGRIDEDKDLITSLQFNKKYVSRDGKSQFGSFNKTGDRK